MLENPRNRTNSEVSRRGTWHLLTQSSQFFCAR